MILGDFLTALGQISDRRFLRVMMLGIGLSLALLIAVYAGFMLLLGWLVPDSVTLPWIGEIAWVDDLASGASLLLMIVLSFFLMIPVASAFTGIFLDDVAGAVEARHYPALPPPANVGFMAAARDSAGFFVLVIVVNALALVGYLLAGPFGPLLFWAVNGYLLGREYFQMVAARRIGRDAARALRRRHAGQIWLAGALMAAPLSLPLLNLVVPVLGAATFTHLFHRLGQTGG